MAGRDVWIPYCGKGPAPDDLWMRWNLDPVLLAALAVLAGTLWIALPARRTPATAAIVVLALVFVSPLCALSSALFTARTVHHVLLSGALAPLLAWALPAPRRNGLALFTLAFAAVFWAWHAPVAYEAALSNDGVYWLMQASLAAVALCFWRAVRAAPAPAAVAALLATTVQMGLLGALLTFLPRAIYAPHALTTAAWGLSPLDDQQLAGLVMWIPASAIYLLAALALLGGRLRKATRPAAA
ncbi:cytochrome c oxidase assembly protein [Caulobacter endophyticus]|uniref:cytochrome c oxidase assembly protein n=1 Tax=Caulobacter endophyticus TaxID=2172652 RepID=UPI00240FB87C|nr:cytochrome c oxidase assembly protein [Caulobacter endophyticus]MDG2529048.1 cytochrome c oxidase assembly protein [Caulobacter endophyticus]